MMYDSGITCDVYARPLQIKSPLKVRVFLWVPMQNKLLSQETLELRDCNVSVGCVLCGNGLLETRDHFMVTCSYSQNFWRGLPVTPVRDWYTLMLKHFYKWGVPLAVTEPATHQNERNSFASGYLGAMV